jgi:hypothetical protein
VAMLKKLFLVSPVAVLFFLLSLQPVLTSCTKDTIIDTVVQVRVDTLKEKDTLLTAAILTANSWKPLEMRGLVNNTYVYYVRGGTNNTQSFDNEYMNFKSNGTGIYHDNVGGETTFTWNFTDATNTKLVWVWNNPSGTITNKWENIVYDNASLRYTEYANVNGVNTLVSETRIPK